LDAIEVIAGQGWIKVDDIDAVAALASAGRSTPLKAAAPLPVDPLEELIRVVNAAQERDAEEECRYMIQCVAIGPRSFKGGGPIRGMTSE
jgi:hypothetical protein